MDEYYSQHALLISRDLALLKKLSLALPVGAWSLTTVRSSHSAEQLLTGPRSFSYVILDEEILDDERKKGHPRSSVAKLTSLSLKANHRRSFLLCVRPNSRNLKSIPSRDSLFAALQKADASLERVRMISGLLRVEKFQPVLISDLDPKASLPFNFYFVDEAVRKQRVFLKKGSRLPKKVTDLAMKEGIRHLYVLHEDLLSSSYALSIKKFETKSRLRRILVSLCDDSNLGSLPAGKKLRTEADAVIASVSTMFSQSRTPLEALEGLTFPRWSLLNHSYNTMVYAWVFSRLLIIDEQASVALAGMLHDLGMHRSLGNWKAGEYNLEEGDHYASEDHVEHSVDILRSKLFPLPKLTLSLILRQHEDLTGTGYPYGLKLSREALEDFVIPLANIIDAHRTVPKGQFEQSFVETFKALQRSNDSEEKIPREILQTLEGLLGISKRTHSQTHSHRRTG